MEPGRRIVDYSSLTDDPSRRRDREHLLSAASPFVGLAVMAVAWSFGSLALAAGGLLGGFIGGAKILTVRGMRPRTRIIGAIGLALELLVVLGAAWLLHRAL